MSDPIVCHCFGYSENDIREDFLKNGHSRILQHIEREKTLGGCRCEVENPARR